jgi:hypothetical protein
MRRKRLGPLGKMDIREIQLQLQQIDSEKGGLPEISPLDISFPHSLSRKELMEGDGEGEGGIDHKIILFVLIYFS